MTDDLDAVRDSLAELLVKVDRLRAAARAQAFTIEPDLGMRDLISAAEGADMVRRAKSTMATWCRANRISGDAGFAIKLKSRWHVSKSRLLKHVEEK